MSAPNGARFQTPTLRADYASVHVDCPAKTNLTLHVGERREEWGGRHALETIYCGVGIYDTVTVTAKEPGTGFSLDLAGTSFGRSGRVDERYAQEPRRACHVRDGAGQRART